MHAFPFTDDDWFRVSEAARAVVNASFAGDVVLRASLSGELLSVLSQLRQKYGEHPAILETQADFTDDPTERVALYEQAKLVAQTGGWATYSIRMSLARVLLEDLGEAGRAMQELLACRDELAARADEGEWKEWEELQVECVRRSG